MDRSKNSGDGSSNGNIKKKNNNGKNKGLQWTNEKHSKFLRLMEASFVRNMLKGNTNGSDNSSNNNNIIVAKLDRFVPDIAESTVDLRRSDRVIRTCNRQRKTSMIRPNKMLHDQVVPQWEDKSSDKADFNH